MASVSVTAKTVSFQVKDHSSACMVTVPVPATPQDVILALIETGSFNSFDGPKVVAKLRKHRDLWRAVVPSDGREGIITLRDLPGDYNMSSLFIRSSGKDDKTLVRLMKRLEADEVNWIDELGERYRSACRTLRESDGRVLRAWWD